MWGGSEQALIHCMLQKRLVVQIISCGHKCSWENFHTGGSEDKDLQKIYSILLYSSNFFNHRLTLSAASNQGSQKDGRVRALLSSVLTAHDGTAPSICSMLHAENRARNIVPVDLTFLAAPQSRRAGISCAPSVERHTFPSWQPMMGENGIISPPAPLHVFPQKSLLRVENPTQIESAAVFWVQTNVSMTGTHS